MDVVLDDMEWDSIEESAWFTTDDELNPGVYTLINDIPSLETGEIIGRINSKVKVSEFTKPYDNVFGIDIYEVLHPSTNQKLYINNGDITR